jgi:carboxymethylenebutenolidase
MSGMIEFQCNGATYSGYLAPAASAKGPGVIVLQEYWGLVGHIKDVADRLGQAGFTALAPDLFEGKTTEEPDEAGSMLMALNIGKTEKILGCAARKLLDMDSVTGDKVGIVGFCMGGQLSLYAACADPDVYGACVDFYGIHPNANPDLGSLKAPVLGFFAETDDYAPPETVSALDAQLTALGKKHEFHTYPGTFHAFFNDDRPAFHPDAAEDAWKRMHDFFDQHLR